MHRIIFLVFKEGDIILSFLQIQKFRLNFTDSNSNAVKGMASFPSCQQISHSNGRTEMKKRRAEWHVAGRSCTRFWSHHPGVCVAPFTATNAAVILSGHDNRGLNMLYYNLRQILSHLIHFRKGMEEEPKLTITIRLALHAKNRRAFPRGPLQLIPSVYLILGWVERERKNAIKQWRGPPGADIDGSCE